MIQNPIRTLVNKLKVFIQGGPILLPHIVLPPPAREKGLKVTMPNLQYWLQFKSNGVWFDSAIPPFSSLDQACARADRARRNTGMDYRVIHGVYAFTGRVCLDGTRTSLFRAAPVPPGPYRLQYRNGRSLSWSWSCFKPPESLAEARTAAQSLTDINGMDYRVVSCSRRVLDAVDANSAQSVAEVVVEVFKCVKMDTEGAER